MRFYLGPALPERVPDPCVAVVLAEGVDHGRGADAARRHGRQGHAAASGAGGGAGLRRRRARRRASARQRLGGPPRAVWRSGCDDHRPLRPAADLREEQRTLAWYLDALERRDRFVASWQTFFEDIDGLILPPAMTSAFTHREADAAVDVDGETVSYSGHGRLLVFRNLVVAAHSVALSAVPEKATPSSA